MEKKKKKKRPSLFDLLSGLFAQRITFISPEMRAEKKKKKGKSQKALSKGYTSKPKKYGARGN